VAAPAVTKAWAILTSALESSSLPEQGAAARAIITNETPRARNLIDGILQDKSRQIRSSVILMMPSGPAMLPLIAEALQDRDLEVRRAAIQQLGRISDPRALALLEDVLLKGDAEMVAYAAGSAERLGPASFGILLRALDTGADQSRKSVARTLDVLINPWVRPQSSENLEALRRLEPTRILAKVMADRDRDVRSFAALILARLGDRAAGDELIRMVEASDPRFGTVVSRHYAMAALNKLGRPGYLAPLTAALASSDERSRLDAAYAMRSFVHPSMRDALNATWRTSSFSDVRASAFESLLAISSDDRELLRAGLVDVEPSIRFKAAERLLALGSDPGSVDVLERLVAEESWGRAVPLTMLSTKGDPGRTAALARSLLPKSAEELAQMRGTFYSYDAWHWLSVVSTLETLKDREAVPALGSLLEWGADQELSARIVRVLVAVNNEASQRILVRALDSPRVMVRIAAAGGVLSVYAPAP